MLVSSQQQPGEGLTYEKVGVDIKKKARAIQGFSALARATYRPEVLSETGGFGGLFALDVRKYPEPVLVSSTDGVGSKLKLAFQAGRHDTVGIDLVAMNVDDLVCQGAEPLFFLDYIGIGKVDEGVLEQIVRGVAEGCRRAGCALVGGETAELPEFYPPGEYELAGFAVGVVNRDRVVDGSAVRPGDALIGLASSGVHSNGYTLARRVLYNLAERPPELGGRTVLEELLEPTRIYCRSLLALRERVEWRAAAHITGGSFGKNIPRVLPPGLGAELNWGAWPVPPVFKLIQERGLVADAEMEKTFNLGLGMVCAVAPEQAEAAVAALRELGEQAYIVGKVVPGAGARVIR